MIAERLIVAYSLIAVILIAAVVALIWLRHNSHHAKYKRRMTRERRNRDS